MGGTGREADNHVMGGDGQKASCRGFFSLAKGVHPNGGFFSVTTIFYYFKDGILLQRAGSLYHSEIFRSYGRSAAYRQERTAVEG